jgi:hypothetical protein
MPSIVNVLSGRSDHVRFPVVPAAVGLGQVTSSIAVGQTEKIPVYSHINIYSKIIVVRYSITQLKKYIFARLRIFSL